MVSRSTSKFIFSSGGTRTEFVMIAEITVLTINFIMVAEYDFPHVIYTVACVK